MIYCPIKGGDGYFMIASNRRRARNHPHPHVGRVFTHSRPHPYGDGMFQLFHKEVWLGPFVMVLHHYTEVDV